MPLHLTKQLKRAIQDDPSKCILLVGAGLSVYGVRQGEKGLPVRRLSVVPTGRQTAVWLVGSIDFGCGNL